MPTSLRSDCRLETRRDTSESCFSTRQASGMAAKSSTKKAGSKRGTAEGAEGGLEGQNFGAEEASEKQAADFPSLVPETSGEADSNVLVEQDDEGEDSYLYQTSTSSMSAALRHTRAQESLEE
ncbi:unnamed protein product [Protopolystoma xenopodis]|uniref:Uncharacterized protein n=1 Tax=Protopolystoma xenopodis TaxID=117903 RepID=A0A3S5AQX6_9PLAT|nr:unnamed protein product [Protopolystoma xenopodis]